MTESILNLFVFILISMYQNFLPCAVEVSVKFSIHSILFICKVTTGDILVPNFNRR